MTDQTPPFGPPAFGPPPTWGQPPLGGPAAPPPKRSSAGLVLGLAGGLLVLALVVVLAFVLLGRDDSSSPSAQEPVYRPTSAPASAPTSDPGTAPGTTPGAPTTTTRPVAVPPGFKLVTDAQEGFSYLMPIPWQTTELTPEKLDAAIDRARDSNPELAAMLEQFRNYKAMGGLSLAIGPSGSGPTGGTTPALNLLAVPGGLTLDQVASGVELSLGAVDGTILSKRSLQVGGKDALRVEVEASVGTASKVHETLLFLQGTDKVYAFTVAGTDAATTTTIVESLRVP